MNKAQARRDFGSRRPNNGTPANRNRITIEHGFLGSYNLHIQGPSQGYKVNRIR